LLVGAGKRVVSSALSSSDEVIDRNGREIQSVSDLELSSSDWLSCDGT
jgi:hypothetical protein